MGGIAAMMAIEVFPHDVGETDLEKIEDLWVVLLVDGHKLDGH